MSTQKADGSLLFETKVDEKGFDSGVKKLGGIAAKGMAAVGASIVAAGTTVAGLGAAAIKVGIEFESAFAGVKKTVDASDEQLSALHDGLIDLSKEIPVTAAGLSAIAARKTSVVRKSSAAASARRMNSAVCGLPLSW